MSGTNQRQLGNTLWKLADKLHWAMKADNSHYKGLFDLFSCDTNIGQYIRGDVNQ